MTKEKRKEDDFPDFIVCPTCGYNNYPDKVKLYGTCLRCKTTLDDKAKFKYNMYNKLRLWKGKRWY